MFDVKGILVTVENRINTNKMHATVWKRIFGIYNNVFNMSTDNSGWKMYGVTVSEDFFYDR